MRLPIYGQNDELTTALREAVKRYDAMTPEAKRDMARQQCEGWGRAEAGFGSDADEAEYAAALRSGDPEAIALVKQKEAERVARYDAIVAEQNGDGT
jgi:hypothetical protein